LDDHSNIKDNSGSDLERNQYELSDGTDKNTEVVLEEDRSTTDIVHNGENVQNDNTTENFEFGESSFDFISMVDDDVQEDNDTTGTYTNLDDKQQEQDDDNDNTQHNQIQEEEDYNSDNTPLDEHN
jgi:hypothetical protein